MNAATVVLFTRDLRVHDHAALVAAAGSGPVVPVFVLDRKLIASTHASPNRVSFLLDSLRDLRASLEARGSTLVVRCGDVVDEAMRIVAGTDAGAVHMSADVSAYATARERRLRASCAEKGVVLHAFPGVTVVPAGELWTGDHQHYRVFTPYWRVWRRHPWRAVAPVPRLLATPADIPHPGVIPEVRDLVAGTPSALVAHGGECDGRRRMDAWLRDGVSGYAATHDQLTDGGTSRLSPYLHLGCVSPLELARRTLEATEDDAFLRQLCWRDFHHQVTAAFPAISRSDYRPRERTRQTRPELLDAWKAGATGVPVVDAAMRQLLDEGWMPNRARLIVAGYLVRTLGIDWRAGAAHFMEWLVDGDVANNCGNWQWTAGTGNDTRPNRGFSVQRQAQRFDRDGSYARAHPAPPQTPAA